MKNYLPKIFVGMLCLVYSTLSAQITDTNHYNYGIWQTFGDPISKTVNPEIRGRLVNFKWADIETSPNVWNWQVMDTALASRAKDSLPIIYMVYTKQDAPDWLYSNGVPKVIEKDAVGNVTGWSPYYANPQYKAYFKRMIDSVYQHVMTLPDSIKSRLVAVQACFGSTGDYISYKGYVDAQYNLTNNDFFNLFKEFTQKYYDDYKNTNPKIYLLSNPKNNGPDQLNWLTVNAPGGWIKTGSLGKGFQLNDEVSKASWLYPILNTPQNANWIRARCEITGDALYEGWWLKCPYKNMFTLMCYGIYWGLDWSNQANEFIFNPLYDSAFGFYNRYAGQKIPDKSVYAMCMLKDAIDASDATRFPAAQYGTVAKTANRFNNVLQPFIPYGAKLEDPANALLSEIYNLDATGTNDVGWGIFPGNYDRFMHQINANATSAGYWNIYTADTTSMFGRFARGFDLAKGKDALYFDLDSAFLSYAPLDAKYPVEVEITYLDSGYGKFQIFYDSKNDVNKSSVQVSCNNTKSWKKISVALNDAYFGNRGINGSDFYIKNAGTENVIFTLVELKRATSDFSNVGIISSPLAAFDTACVNSSVQTKSVNLSASFLDGTDVKIGPYPGYRFALSSEAVYSDSIVWSGYGSNFNLGLYVQLRTDSVGDFSGAIPVIGGGDTLMINTIGVIANSSPQLNATVHNVSCYNAKDGSIDLNPTDGTGPYSYSWKNTGFFKDTNEDISALPPSDYTVTVTSFAGCVTSATYTITQPDALQASLAADNMLCKNTTTTLYVTATGGTQPYIGTGNFTVSTGTNQFTVTDANGCSDTRSMYVANGTLTAPAKPGNINSPDADVTGLCAGGNFSYSITSVATATSYTWSLPGGCSMTSATYDSTGITLSAPAGFSTGSLSVTANNACGISTASVKTITGAPGAPGVITGNAYVLPSQTGLVYSVPSVAGLTYTWTVPAGVSILSGQNTATINVKWGTNSGNVTVKANNNCGISTATVLYVSVAGGTFVSSVESFPQFDTTCVNGSSVYKSFNLSASGLSGENVVVGPVDGFKLSTSANGIYADTVMYSGYGTTLNKIIYVKFMPNTEAAYSSSIPVTGGGGQPIGIGATGVSVNSSPVLSSVVNNISCYNSKNGSIDLSISGGVGPFSYNWSGGYQPTYDPTAQDISGLTPNTYIVTVTSYAGCTTSAFYTVTQPDQLQVTLAADEMYCKNSSTIVHVTATGGTLPYVGTGDMTGIGSGTATFTVTDNNGCVATKSIYVSNGVNTAPAKPGIITSADADASGICGGGNFNFSIDPVATANTYTWTGPNGSSISSSNADSTQIILSIPSGITTDSVKVTAANVCGTSTASVKTLSAVPGKPGTISGPSAVLPSQTGIVYSVPAVSGVIYKWTVPTGATIVAGANTSTITVNWGTKAGNVVVKAQNNCGISLASGLAVGVSSAVFVPSVTSLPVFDTTCVAGLSVNKSFTFSATGLSGSAVLVGPATGFKFSATSGGTYTDSLVFTSYGTSFTNQPVFVKFSPVALGETNNLINIRGGGAPAMASISVSGNAVSTSPALSALITSTSCYGAKNGAIDLKLDGGVGPFSYNWTGSGTYDPTQEDISGLSALDYTVAVTSYGGCTAVASYTVTQPDPLIVSAVADQMECKFGTTTVNVNAAGGTLPYTGTGSFAGISAGINTFTVTDGNGCTTAKSISVANGTGLPPAKPTLINSPSTDATGICGGGSFIFSIDPVAGATSYSWIPPSNSSIVSTSPDGTQVTISIPSGIASDSVKVAALNVCGASANLAKIITAVPGKTSAISGPTSVLPSQSGLVYSVTEVPGLSYTWTVPAGSAITAGANTASITVKWGTKSGNITVKAVNACGSSAASSLGVAVASTAFSLSTTALPAFDTACINSLSASKSFTFSAAGLNGTNVVVGPLAGFKLSTTNTGTYTDSLVLTGTSFTNQAVFVKFNPSTAKTYSGNVVVKGGGANAVSVAVSGAAVSSSPVISAGITNVTCAGLSNGAIDLTTTGGTGPFTYSWTGGGTGATYTPSAEDIAGLAAANYNVTVTSYKGCTVEASYTVAQPAAVAVTATADAMVCRNSTTNVYVSAAGGTLPYTGTGTFTVSAGTYSYAVTDANGCSGTKSISVANGKGLPPAKPVVINSAAADALGVCGTGNFSYAIDPVATATAYTWTLPAGTTLVSGDGTTSIMLTPDAGFTSGTLAVTASNTCGTSAAQSKALSYLPGKPGVVTGPITVTAGQTGLVYSVPAVAGLTYKWVVGGGSKITAGQGTSSISVTWGGSSGAVKASAVNSCGTSVASSLSVTVGAAFASSSSVQTKENIQLTTAAVYPNPVRDLAYVRFNAEKEYKYTIEVTDLTGKPLIRKTGITLKGTNIVSLDVHAVTNGTYMVSIFNENGQRSTLKLVKE